MKTTQKKIIFYDAYLSESGLKGGSCIALLNLIKGLSSDNQFDLILLSNTTNNILLEEYKSLNVRIVSNKYLNNLLIYDRSTAILQKIIQYLFSALKANIWFIGFLRKEKPEIIVYNDQRGATTFSIANLVIRSKSKILTIVRSTKEVKSLFNKLNYLLSHNIVAVSESIYNSLPPRIKHKSTTIYDGIIEKSQRKNVEPDSICKLITVANISRYKGIDLVIRSLSTFSKEFQSDIIYTIVGGVKETDYYNDIQNLYIDLECNFILKFQGQQEDVYKYLMESDIFVLPSREEGFGLVLLEAMDCSLPLIGSKVGGIPEIIQDGYNGLLFNVGDSQDLNIKLMELVSDQALRLQMGINSKTRLKKFTTNETISEYSYLF